MHLGRPVIAAHPMGFGRGQMRVVEAEPAPAGMMNDLKLFAGTFLAGFLFISILIG